MKTIDVLGTPQEMSRSKCVFVAIAKVKLPPTLNSALPVVQYLCEVNIYMASEILQINFTTTYGGEYIGYFMADKFTDEEALLEIDLRDMGGANPDKKGYFLIVPKHKAPILAAIRENIIAQQDCDDSNSIFNKGDN